MNSRRLVLLHRQPLASKACDDDSDFSAIREHSSTPDRPIHSKGAVSKPCNERPLFCSAPSSHNIRFTSDEDSDFPPIRVRDSTPDRDPPIRATCNERPSFHSAPSSHNIRFTSDEDSDFPPIRVRDSTPDRDPPICAKSGHYHQPPPPKKGLGKKNILNTIKNHSVVS
jgi:hypothetical protein